MVHEAVVNAMKHASATRVNVTVDEGTDRLRIVVSDDGRGFPFKGLYDHRALGDADVAPRSLFDRVTALGGKMSIESADHGSRIEMVVSL
jgi:signal transduction histidine kinase